MTEDDVADQISIMDLETEKVRTIDAAKGTKIKPLAFMTEDFVYGIANESDISTDAAGSAVYPMAKVEIIDTSSDNFTQLKEYAKDGIYVTGATKSSYTLYLDRVTKQDGTYVTTTQDTIKDTAGEQNKTVSLVKTASDTQGLATTYVMADLEDGQSIHSLAARDASLATINDTRSISISTTEEQETYFVYVGNRVTLTTQNLNKAIMAADADMGLVVDNQQRYIWNRGKKSYVNAFNDIEASASPAVSAPSCKAKASAAKYTLF